MQISIFNALLQCCSILVSGHPPSLLPPFITNSQTLSRICLIFDMKWKRKEKPMEKYDQIYLGLWCAHHIRNRSHRTTPCPPSPFRSFVSVSTQRNHSLSFSLLIFFTFPLSPSRSSYEKYPERIYTCTLSSNSIVVYLLVRLDYDFFSGHLLIKYVCHTKLIYRIKTINYIDITCISVILILFIEYKLMSVGCVSIDEILKSVCVNALICMTELKSRALYLFLIAFILFRTYSLNIEKK